MNAILKHKAGKSFESDFEMIIDVSPDSNNGVFRRYHMMGSVNIKLVIALALLGAFALFVFQNTEIVDLRFFFWRLSVSRVLLLFGALAIGFASGVLVSLEIARRRGRK